MRVRVAIPQAVPYPHAAVVQGLKALGHEIAPLSEITHDLVVTWTPWHGTVRDVEARSHRIVVVIENGWFSPLQDKRLYQVALWGFNGTGAFVEGPPGRLGTWNLPPVRVLAKAHGPWLVVAQRRGTGDPRSMPPDWPERVTARLRDHVQVNIHYRGRGENPYEVMERLHPRGVVTWSSSFSSWALWSGVPVFYCGPGIMGWRVARRWHEDQPAPEPYEVDRMTVETEFQRLAWAQWSETEIATGEPFARLLRDR
jgi:hypothetical protein